MTAQQIIDSLPDRQETLRARLYGSERPAHIDAVEYACILVDSVVPLNYPLPVEMRASYDAIKRWLVTRRDCDLGEANQLYQLSWYELVGNVHSAAVESVVMLTLGWSDSGADTLLSKAVRCVEDVKHEHERYNPARSGG